LEFGEPQCFEKWSGTTKSMDRSGKSLEVTEDTKKWLEKFNEARRWFDTVTINSHTSELKDYGKISTDNDDVEGTYVQDSNGHQ